MDRHRHQSYKLVTPPASEPVAVGEMLTWLRLDTGCGGTDAEVDQLISAARSHIESVLSRQLVTATWDLWLDEFPWGGWIELERCPVQAVEYIKYFDGTGWQTLDPTQYRVDAVSEPGRVKLCNWPAVCGPAGVQIRFTAGYELVPHEAVQAIRLLVGHWYQNREAVGQVGSEVAFSFRALLNSLRWR